MVDGMTMVWIALGLLGVIALVAIFMTLGRGSTKAPQGGSSIYSGATPSAQSAENDPRKSQDIPLSVDQMVLLVHPGAQPYRIQKTEYLIGRRRKDANVRPPDLDLKPHAGDYASRYHAFIYLDSNTRQWCITDLGSKNGTFINERQLQPKEVHVLKHRDRIGFTDRFEVVFEHPGSSEALPRIANLEVRELVAKGGMAAVYKAIGADGNFVAVKVPIDYGEDPRLAAMRLEDEYKILSRLNSRRAARAIQFGQSGDGRPALVMEFLFGQTLKNYLQKYPVSPIDAIMIGGAIADGLAALHGLEHVHCDLKPDNVMMRQVAGSPTDVARDLVLIDFGIAMENRTMRKNVFGSANYQSPEHILGQQLTLKSDVYSLGCMLYEMITGSRLFPEAQESDAKKFHEINAIIKEFQVHRMPMRAIERARENNRQVPQELDSLVMLMLEKSPNVRPDLTIVTEELARLRQRYCAAGFHV